MESRSVIRNAKNAPPPPFAKSCASYFRFARFNTFPLYYLRVWHRLACSLLDRRSKGREATKLPAKTRLLVLALQRLVARLYPLARTAGLYHAFARNKKRIK